MLRRWFGKGGSSARIGVDSSSPAAQVLRILDKAADDITFPMLDNGYVYLAAARLALFRSEADWAVTTEIFGFSPRSGLPDVSVWTIGSRLIGRKTPDDFVDQAAYSRYLAAHAHDDAAFFFPVEPGNWQDPDDIEFVNPSARSVTVRGREWMVPGRETYRAHAIKLSEPDRVAIFELCRFLAAVAREDVLATPGERRTHVPPELEEVLVLDDWHHPDVAGGEHPSGTETFRSLAQVLVTGDTSLYEPRELGNTHWSNWPMGGTL